MGEPPPIPCAGNEINNSNGRDFDCDYPESGKVLCEQCIVNGGPLDPRTGKRYRKPQRSTT